MKTFLAVFFIALGTSLVFTPILRNFCTHFGLYDIPNDSRRIHVRAIPRLGGVVIYFAVQLAVLLPCLLSNPIADNLRENKLEIFTIFLPATLVFLIGIYDDLRDLNPKIKFLAQAAVGTLFFILGGRIILLYVPMLGIIELPFIVSFLLTILWVIAITNAFNLIDGMDGLASGAGLFAAIVLLVVSMLLGHLYVMIIALALAGALIGFLRYNFNPASIFLGDSGALLIGFLLAALSVKGSQKASTAVAVAIPIIAFGLPIVETGMSIARRLISRKPIFEADREHIHHMLLKRGWSQKKVTIALYGVCAVFGLLALTFVSDLGRVTGLILIIIGSVLIVALSHLPYHEVDEIKATIKRGVIEGGRRTANNVGIRRASRLLSTATTFDDIFKAAEQVLSCAGFVYATVTLGDVKFSRPDSLSDKIVRVEAKQEVSAADYETTAGLVYWSWDGGSSDVDQLLETGDYWALHLPLKT
ncbi:MAG: glycosyltransferase family 4 protein, partial [Pyrinomonadaceae bacterium]